MAKNDRSEKQINAKVLVTLKNVPDQKLTFFTFSRFHMVKI